MKIAVKSLKNKKVRDLELPDEVFGYPYKEHLIHTVVQANLAARRSGTHSTKTRGEVTGSGKKPWRQKGTGRARAGHTRNPLWRTGGVAHGPKPRSYVMRISSREKKSAMKSALSRKLRDDGILVVDSFELESHRTAALASVVSGLGVSGKALLVDDWNNENLGLAARNNPKLDAIDALGVTVYDILRWPNVVFSEAALSRLVEVLSK